MVWMRNAALPNFRKLYRRIDHENITELPDARVKFVIDYRKSHFQKNLISIFDLKIVWSSIGPRVFLAISTTTFFNSHSADVTIDDIFILVCTFVST